LTGIAVLTVAIGGLVGFGASIFGVFALGAILGVLIIAGLVPTDRRPLLARLTIGVLLGAVLYVALGLLMNLVDEPSSGHGSTTRSQGTDPPIAPFGI
jgi:hypothetical protein